MRLGVLACFLTLVAAAPNVKFHEACAGNDVETVKTILSETPAVLNEIGPEGGQSCFMRAVLFGSKAVVQYLLDNTDVDVNLGEKDGYTPLHGAAFQGRAEIAKILIDRGLDPLDQHADGYSPIHRASWGSGQRHTDTIRVFLEAGVPADLKADDGRTAYDMTHSPASMRLLMDYGARGDDL
ncbi:unnamed protein product [Aphanomyces euteiches]|uniref:Uncharacterized protein n=1 Tax=Aphanomyces euteiches TaxID=100861 RepID=A0A6G0W4T3_9STRA|nr:hypothetical protein Ae201684_018694 [Aphanomyces euteiches]KAH9088535.1 hypothetical protein Ae201684P_017144 [Aphanomyces euteiches]KAH9157921.1 hypothetical protein AeRB84_000303 [Aphanomyces euteiches]